MITWSGTLPEEVWTPKTALCADSAGGPEPSVSLVVADVAEVVEDPLDSVDASGVCCKVGRKASALHCKLLSILKTLPLLIFPKDISKIGYPMPRQLYFYRQYFITSNRAP